MTHLYADQLEAFLAVVESGSFVAAGERMARDASIVSRRISALENRLGIRLLERSTRQVTLTEAGRRYAGHLREASELLSYAEDEVRSLGATPSGVLRLSLPTSFGRMWVAPLLPQFLAAFPQIRLECVFTDAHQDLLAQKLDVAIRIGAMKDSQLKARRLAPTRRLVCAAPSYLRGAPTLRKPADLRQHECLGFTGMFSYPVWHFTRQGERVAVTTQSRMASNDIHSLIAAAVAGQGVLMAADWLVTRELQSGALVPVLKGWLPSGETGAYLVRASSQFSPAKTDVFCRWMIDAFKRAPWLA